MICKIWANGIEMGTFEGQTENQALDAYAQDAGYENYQNMLERVPDSYSNEDMVERVE